MSSTGVGNSTAVNSVSTQAFTTALVTNVIICAAEIAVFVGIFRLFPAIYEPRTYIPRLASLRAHKLPRTPFGWATAIWKAPRQDIIRQNGLDAYMFLQFLYLMLWIFTPMWIASWIILLPVNSVRSGGDQTGLYKFTFGNIGPTQQSRYAAHVIFVYFFAAWVLYLTRKEMANFIQLRMAFLSSPEHAQLAQAKTVLVTGLPSEYRSNTALEKLTGYMPGGSSKIWLARDIGSAVVQLFDRRNKAAQKLEASETKLVKIAARNRAKAEKTASKKGSGQYALSNSRDPEGKQALAEELVDRKSRPTHKQGSRFPCMGKKVDTIDWAVDELVTVLKDLEEERAKLHERPATSAAFIEFETQIAAHVFHQTTLHHLPLRMAAKYTEVHSDDVIFGNLGIDPYQQRVRYAMSWAATLGLVIAWAFPVSFVGLLSNVNQLCARAHWIRWLCRLPSPLNGIIQGFLPPVALTVLFIFLPIILRLFARFEGIPLKTKIELSLMNRYFLFLVLHGFLIVTLASGLIAALPQIANNPGSTVSLLAQNLPKASNFFLTYLLTTGLSGAGGAFLSIVTLVLHYVFLFLLATTPRKTYNVKYDMQGLQWGTTFPNMTLITVISLAYSVISPLINGFAVLTFALFAFTYKYLFLWVYDFPASQETGGLFFPIAINHIYVGLYIMQICLCGLFFLVRNERDQVSALPEAILMIILIVATALFHLLILSAFKPLVRNLPLDLGIQIEDDAVKLLPLAQVDEKLAKLKLGGLKIQPLGNKLAEEKGRLANNISTASKKVFKLGKDKDTASSSPEIAMQDFANASPEVHDGQDRESQDGSNRIRAEDETNVDSSEFAHPATWQTLEPIWIPADTLGIGEAEAARLRDLGIPASTQGAALNKTHHVRVSRPPPEVEFEAGMQRMPTYGTNKSSPTQDTA